MKALCAIFVMFFALPAVACSLLEHPTREELFLKAKSVFRARVTEAKLASIVDPYSTTAEVIEIVEAKYELREVYKGQPPLSGLVRDMPFGIGNCSLGLLPGMDYVFYPDENDFVLILGGSFGYLNADGADVKPQLEAIRKLALKK